MAIGSKIQWTDATWNPTVGCRIVSPGCTNCYAMKLAGRLERIGGKAGAKYAGLTAPSKAGPVWNGTVRLASDDLLAPLKWRKPRRIFVNSMSDLFAEDLPDEAIDQVFAVMALCPQHIFQILTKRAARLRTYSESFPLGRLLATRLFDQPLTVAEILGKLSWPLPNVWLGVSVEDQQRADERIPLLLETPAAVRFISAEPLLGPVDVAKALRPCDRTYAADRVIDWVIVGGESGPRARPMHPDWARSLRDQCATAGVPYFFKQWGEWGVDAGPYAAGRDPIFEGSAKCAVLTGERWTYFENGFAPPLKPKSGEWVYRLGKHRAGRLLDGRTHNDFPRASAKVAA